MQYLAHVVVDQASNHSSDIILASDYVASRLMGAVHRSMHRKHRVYAD